MKSLSSPSTPFKMNTFVSIRVNLKCTNVEWAIGVLTMKNVVALKVLRDLITGVPEHHGASLVPSRTLQWEKEQLSFWGP